MNQPPEIDLAGLTAGQRFDDEEDGIDFRRYLSALLRYKWLVLGLTLAGFAVGVGLGVLQKPLYQARASVQVPAPGTRFAPGNPMASAPLVDGQGWLELLRSFAVFDEVVRRRRTYLELSSPGDSALFRDFALAERYVPDQYRLQSLPGNRLQLSRLSGEVVDEAALGDSLGRPAGLLWAPAAAPAGRQLDFRVRSPRDASVALSQALVTDLSRDGSLIRLSLSGEDPQLTASVLNDVVMRFIEVATTLKREKLTSVTSALGEQLATSRSDLTAAETELQRYKVETITLPSDRAGTAIASGLSETSDPVRQAFFQLRLDREGLERDRAAIERALQATSDSVRSFAVSLGTIPSVRDSRDLMASLDLLTTRRADLQQLRVAFAPGHPQLRQIEQEVGVLERQTIPAQARALVADLDARMAELDGRIGASSRDMQQMPVRFTEEQRRTRELQIAQMIYTQLQSAYEQARLAELSAAPDVRLLDPAVPPTRPERDKVLQILLMGLAGGLGLGVALALLLDRFDVRIRYPDQVTRDLGLPILGALPMLTKGPDGAARAEDVSALLESTRAIRMAMLYAHGTAGTFITTITSPGPGDGKSFTSANIAKAFGASGRRTLLIDADNRRGALHRVFGVERKPGLMDLLTGTVTLDEVVHTLPDSGIDFIAGGTRLAAAPEMLASPRMSQLVMELRARYQAIIIDSPPLGAGIDPLILASLSGTLVMVLRNGVTDRTFAEARLDALKRLPIRVLGAVLNDVKASEGMYRYYSYIPGYRSEDEEQPDLQTQRKLLERK